MTPVPVVLATATQQVGQVSRGLHRLTVGRLVPYSGFVAFVVAAGLSLVTVAALQSAQLGRTMSDGPLDASLFLIGVLAWSGALGGTFAVVSRDLWRRQVLSERERLAVLPLGRRSLALLSLVPVLLPTVVGGAVAVVCVAAYCLASGANPFGVITGFASGLLLAFVLGTVASLLARLPGLRRLGVGLPVGIGVMLLIAHAVWAISDPARAGLAPHRWSPLVGPLSREDPYASWQVAAVLACLLAAVWAWVATDTGAATTRKGVTFRDGTSSGGRVPGSWRVPVGVATTIARQSTLATEIGLAVVVCGGAAWVAARMDALDRAEAAAGTVLVAAVFSALPVLGLRSSLGPVGRLWVLGARPADVRRGLLLACVGAQVPGVLVATAVLVLSSTSAGVVVRLLVLSVTALGIAVLVANVMRSVTDQSVGRALAGLALVAPVFVGLQAGAAQASIAAVVGGAVVAGAAGLAALRLTLSPRVVT
ncbi:hypothetical protein ACHAAC_01775 [Aeromicrobium sp. CF4.19]|uniref:hypothetical protein n=1 Tax=Aeromicrobium sp. CF4.19 TaxID=3373082 RepID=UPI003EE76FE7